MKKISIDILPNFFSDGNRFNTEEAVKLCGKIAGVCYNKEGFKNLENEPEERTMKRVDRTLNSGHHSVYDHAFINFNIHNIPKILAMVLNNEKQYTTSEKSARYTPVVRNNDSIITDLEEKLYNKWVNIFDTKIKEKYGDIFNDSKINKLAQENARYMVTVFMPTELIYTTSLRQINYIASWMWNYIKLHNHNNSFESKLAHYMSDFICELSSKGVLVDKLMQNEKNRKISLFDNKIQLNREYFGDVYTTNYKGSFALLAQAQRHRTIDYKMSLLNEKEYFIPPIIEDDTSLKDEWLSDIISVKNVNPQGELLLINECGKYDDFILKCKERLCSCAQLEINNQTRETLMKYKEALVLLRHPLANDIIKYTKGARCTFPDYTCNSDCKFNEGKVLKRKI